MVYISRSFALCITFDESTTRLANALKGIHGLKPWNYLMLVHQFRSELPFLENMLMKHAIASEAFPIFVTTAFWT